MSPHSSRTAAIGVACALASATAYSTAGVIVRRIELPAWDISFWRSLLLLVAIVPLIVLRRRHRPIDIRSAAPALLLSGLLLAGSFISFILALGLAPVANVVIVFGATPFITAVLARALLREPLHRHTVAAMVVAAAGLGLSVADSVKSGAALGMGVAFLVVLFISFNYVTVRHRRDVDMTPSLAVAGLAAALASLPFAHPAEVTARELPWLVALGPGQLAVGLLFYMASLKRIPASRAALLGLLELVLAPIWVWLVDGESPGHLTLLGGVIVIGAAAANVWLDSRHSSG
jgi:drug/metabolite transporter (DMT)-like permease